MVKHLNHFRKNEALAACVSAFIIIFIMLMGINVTGAVTGTQSICGNGACEVGENFINCKKDCNSICGNSICESSEKIICPIDCRTDSQEIESVKFQSSLTFVALTAMLLVLALMPISKSGTRQKVRIKSRRRRRR